MFSVVCGDGGRGTKTSVIRSHICTHFGAYSHSKMLCHIINWYILQKKLGYIILISNIIIYSPQDIAIFDNLIGPLLEAYEAMYHYYLINGKPANYEFGACAHMQGHIFQNNKYPIFPPFVPSFFPR